MEIKERRAIAQQLVESANVERHHKVLVVSEGVGEMLPPLIARAGEVHYWGNKSDLSKGHLPTEMRSFHFLACSALMVDKRVQPNMFRQFDRILFLQEIDCRNPIDYIQKFVELIKDDGLVYAVLLDRYTFSDIDLPITARIARNAFDNKYWKHLIAAKAG
jgi:hypothetical protein